MPARRFERYLPIGALMPTTSNAQLRSELESAIKKVREKIAIQSTADHYIGSEPITQEA